MCYYAPHNTPSSQSAYLPKHFHSHPSAALTLRAEHLHLAEGERPLHAHHLDEDVAAGHGPGALEVLLDTLLQRAGEPCAQPVLLQGGAGAHADLDVLQRLLACGRRRGRGRVRAGTGQGRTAS